MLLSATGFSAAEDAPDIDFAREVQPIFAKRCFSCHGPDAAEGGLRLHDQKAALAELESGSHAIIPGQPRQSVLLERVSSDDESLRMPPEGKPLTPGEVDVIRRWIAQGAAWEEHWAFRPARVLEPPAVKATAGVRNPIDAFILHRLERRGLKPNPPADKVALLRRVYHDLTGLPPTPEEVEAFIADASPDAYEQVIDRLLESPRYGERWARHWLDVVRFAETNSFERDGPKPNAWRYRDYVIRSLNDDKPYDQFIREQLAGDELPDVTPETIIATGFYRLGLWDDEPADEQQARFDELDDIITTVSQGFLGLTVNCARCHDHKIDPIPQTDYYRLLAFFHEIRPYGIRSDQTSWNQTDISPPEVAEQHRQLDERKSELRERMQPIEQRGIEKMAAEDQRKSEGREREKLLREKLQQFLGEEDWTTYAALKTQWDDLQAVQLPPRESALSVKCLPEPQETFLLQRGNPHVPGEQVEPGYPQIFEAGEPVLPNPVPDAATSGRRLVLANWIGSPENRLTSRVMVNRVWQHHFGRGIVRSTNNFGQIGEPPTHPDLLDWLSHEFVKVGWRLKPLHKLMLLSNTYQMSSTGNAEALARDPQNDLFWRFDMRRLSAEELRDTIHAVNGRLNLKMFGPGYYPTISQEVLQGQSQPGLGWGKSSPEEQARRSVYIHVKRSLITPILADFDFPETDSSCAARFVTTQPAQALGMMNGEFLNEQAIMLAKRVREECGEVPEKQVRRTLRLALCREPDEASIARGLGLMRSLQEKHGLDEATALRYYCLVVLNLNEFVYLD